MPPSTRGRKDANPDRERHCKHDVMTKLAEVRRLHSALARYRGKVFVLNGLDKDSQTYPLRTELGGFLTHARSIFQYACAEARGSGKLRAYQGFVETHPLIGFFRDARDIEVHDGALGVQTEVRLHGGPLRASPPDPDEPPSKAEPQILVHLTRRLEVNESLLSRLEQEERPEIADAARRGEPIYEGLTFDGKCDVFELIDEYVGVIEEFVEYGIAEGFIS